MSVVLGVLACLLVSLELLVVALVLCALLGGVMIVRRVEVGLRRLACWSAGGGLILAALTFGFIYVGQQLGRPVERGWYWGVENGATLAMLGFVAGVMLGGLVGLATDHFAPLGRPR